jgi:hypothetical protein
MNRVVLDELADLINRRLGELSGTYFVQFAYGRPRLFRSGGAVEVSPRLPTGELAQWMRAYISGIEAAQEAMNR